MIFVNICPNARETRLKSTAKDRRLQHWVPLVLLLHNINCLLECSSKQWAVSPEKVWRPLPIWSHTESWLVSVRCDHMHEECHPACRKGEWNQLMMGNHALVAGCNKDWPAASMVSESTGRHQCVMECPSGTHGQAASMWTNGLTLKSPFTPLEGEVSNSCSEIQSDSMESIEISSELCPAVGHAVVARFKIEQNHVTFQSCFLNSLPKLSSNLTRWSNSAGNSALIQENPKHLLWFDNSTDQVRFSNSLLHTHIKQERHPPAISTPVGCGKEIQNLAKPCDISILFSEHSSKTPSLLQLDRTRNSALTQSNTSDLQFSDLRSSDEVRFSSCLHDALVEQMRHPHALLWWFTKQTSLKASTWWCHACGSDALATLCLNWQQCISLFEQRLEFKFSMPNQMVFGFSFVHQITLLFIKSSFSWLLWMHCHVGTCDIQLNWLSNTWFRTDWNIFVIEKQHWLPCKAGHVLQLSASWQEMMQWVAQTQMWTTTDWVDWEQQWVACKWNNPWCLVWIPIH